VRVVFWAAATFAFAMAVLPHPPQVPLSPSDKVQHVIAFATLGLLSVWAYSATPVAKLIIRLSLFGGLIELVQAIPVLHRDSDVFDWFADTIAAGLVALFVAWVRGRSAGPR
jgi:VanZ family protein